MTTQSLMETREKMRKQKGFSLIELLIVVAIILIIAAIAIPNLLRARIAANESSAAASVRTIDTAMVSYQTSFPATGYPTAIASLGTGGVNTACPGAVVATACIIDGQLATGTKSGYSFALASAGATPRTAYTVTGNPNNTTSGTRYFFSDESGVIRYATGGAAVVTSPALQ